MEDKEIAEFVQPLYINKDSMHDFKHILRIQRKVRLYKEPYKNVDEPKLTFLIYFHGLVPYVKEHEVEIIRMGFRESWISALYRHTENPQSIEEMLVSDANLWETVGEFGIKKALQVGSERGQTLNQTFNIMRSNIDKVRFYTKLGKEYGTPGIKTVQEYLRKKTIHDNSGSSSSL